MTTDRDALDCLATPAEIRLALARRVREADTLRRLLRLAETAAADRADITAAEPAYIMRLREIAADRATLPHVGEHIAAALADHDARRAGT